MKIYRGVDNLWHQASADGCADQFSERSERRTIGSTGDPDPATSECCPRCMPAKGAEPPQPTVSLSTLFRTLTITQTKFPGGVLKLTRTPIESTESCLRRYYLGALQRVRCGLHKASAITEERRQVDRSICHFLRMAAAQHGFNIDPEDSGSELPEFTVKPEPT